MTGRRTSTIRKKRKEQSKIANLQDQGYISIAPGREAFVIQFLRAKREAEFEKLFAAKPNRSIIGFLINGTLVCGTFLSLDEHSIHCLDDSGKEFSAPISEFRWVMNQ